jgi:hypothetical protein
VPDDPVLKQLQLELLKLLKSETKRRRAEHGLSHAAATDHRRQSTPNNSHRAINQEIYLDT